MPDKFSIKPYLTDLEILHQTAEQIKKDFAFFSLPVNFSGNKETAYNELCEQIQPHIKKLLDTNYEQLMSVLYRIDIPEQQITNNVQHLTDLIIKRCLQKVVLRKLFSKNEDI